MKETELEDELEAEAMEDLDKAWALVEAMQVELGHVRDPWLRRALHNNLRELYDLLAGRIVEAYGLELSQWNAHRRSRGLRVD